MSNSIVCLREGGRGNSTFTCNRSWTKPEENKESRMANHRLQPNLDLEPEVVVDSVYVDAGCSSIHSSVDCFTTKDLIGIKDVSYIEYGK